MSAVVTNAAGQELPLQEAMEGVIADMRKAHNAGGKIIFIGNGGSAGIASHQAFDYWKNGGLRATCFNDASLLTGGGNDFGYPDVFAKPIAMFASPNDLLIAISSSGQSPNIVRAAEEAHRVGCRVVTLSAFKSDNPLRRAGHANIYLPTDSYGYAEIGHLTVLHILLDYMLTGEKRASGRVRESKIKKPGELADIVRAAKAEGKKVVHCHGVFDLIHPGHIHHFEQARKLGDIVYVGAVADRFVRKGPGRPVFSEDVRMGWLAALESVDYVVLNEEEGPWSLMRLVRPHIYIKGESERVKLENPSGGLSQDKRVMEEIGGELRFTPELEIHSTDLFKQLGIEK